MGEAATARPGRAHLVLGSQPNVAQARPYARSRGCGARETSAHAAVPTRSATAQPAPARWSRAEPKAPCACLGHGRGRYRSAGARVPRFGLSTQRGTSGTVRSFSRLWRARNLSSRGTAHPQRHSAASASTVEQSGAQGTIRLLRAWVKPPQLGRGARTSFWALNPTWRKRRRTLVPSVLARAKPKHTRRRPKQPHSQARPSNVHASRAPGPHRIHRARV
jgi:hypothetical protein